MVFNRGLKQGARVILYRQLSVMLRNGVDFPEACKTLAEGETGKRTREMLNEINTSFSSGKDAAEVVGLYPELFGPVLVDMLQRKASGEQLAEMLTMIADEQMKADLLGKRLLSSAYYPVTILMVALVIMAVILVFVVPSFERMFEDFGSSLPLPTQIVVSLSNLVSDYSVLFIIALVAFVIAFKRSQRFFAMVTSIIPVVRKQVSRWAAVSFLRNLAINLSAGAPVSAAVANASSSVSNIILRERLIRATQHVTDFSQLKAALAATGVFSTLTSQMIDVGSKSGDMRTVLAELSDYYESEVEDSLNTAIPLMDVAFLLGVGLAIGFMVIAMYLPIFKMGEVIG